MKNKVKIINREMRHEIKAHIFLIIFGVFMVFPLIWMVFGTFKEAVKNSVSMGKNLF